MGQLILMLVGLFALPFKLFVILAVLMGLFSGGGLMWMDIQYYLRYGEASDLIGVILLGILIGGILLAIYAVWPIKKD